jgi:hypothetical protein
LTRYVMNVCITCMATPWYHKASAVSSKWRVTLEPTVQAGALALCRSSPSTAEAGTLILGKRRSKSSRCHQGQLGSAPLQCRLVQQAATSRECCQRCLASSLDQVGLSRLFGLVGAFRKSCKRPTARIFAALLPPLFRQQCLVGARHCCMHM